MDRRILVSLAFLGIALGVCPVSSAEDVSIPPWRGDVGATYQRWVFSANTNPVVPDELNNEFGGSLATISLGSNAFGWMDAFISVTGRYGHWDIGAGGTMLLGIDNHVLPLEHKEVWVQVTYYEGFLPKPDVTVPSAVLLESDTTLVEDLGDPFGFPEGWHVELTKWRIEPNPKHESIVISGVAGVEFGGALIDEVIVDTTCGPKPSVTGDFNGDDLVDYRDLAIMCGYWMRKQAAVNLAAPDDIINLADVSMLLGLWSEGP